LGVILICFVVFWHFRFGIEPVSQQAELFSGNFPRSDSVKQMIEQRRRKIYAAES
jgi:hypothetical protein